ncbi:MAG: hypothetical protein K0S27_89 [Gammaproteobacteria bacterium]|jgi:hypothetical protein|nr:hypothetical protein [Gammaproteobacteria bacterium]
MRRKINLILCLLLFSRPLFASDNASIFNESQKYPITITYIICPTTIWATPVCSNPVSATIPAVNASRSNVLVLPHVTNSGFVRVTNAVEAENPATPTLMKGHDCVVGRVDLSTMTVSHIMILSDYNENNPHITCSTINRDAFWA